MASYDRNDDLLGSWSNIGRDISNKAENFVRNVFSEFERDFTRPDLMGGSNIFNCRRSTVGPDPSCARAEEAKVMACEACSARFTVWKRKKQCSYCLYFYCGGCLMKTVARDRKLICMRCQIFMRRPLTRTDLLNLKIKDLQWFLMSKHISMKGCVEKSDLIDLILRHVNHPPGYEPPFAGRARRFSDPSAVPRAQQDPSFSNSPTAYSYVGSQIPSDYVRLNPGVSTSSDPMWTRGDENMGPRYTPPGNDDDRSRSSRPESRSSGEETREDVSDCDVEEGSDDGAEEIVEIMDRQSAEQSVEESSAEEEEDEEEVQMSAERCEVIELSSSDEESQERMESAPNVEPLIEEVEEEEEKTANSQVSFPTDGHLTLKDIKQIGDLDVLTVKQLKELLASNRVTYKGCCEKQELLEKVRRLWTDVQHGKKAVDSLSYNDICKICMDAPIDCVMLECGHMATCTSCGKQMSECPICRQYVIRVVRTFRA